MSTGGIASAVNDAALVAVWMSLGRADSIRVSPLVFQQVYDALKNRESDQLPWLRWSDNKIQEPHLLVRGNPVICDHGLQGGEMSYVSNS